LIAAQEEYLSRLLASDLPRVTIGPYRAPARLGEFMRCWGRAEDEPGQKYRASVQNCSSENSIFVFDDVRTGSIDFEHVLLESRGLGWIRFYKLFEARFGSGITEASGLEEDFTEFGCRTRFVESGQLPLRVALCIRAYKRLPGLYDFWLRAATLDRYDKGLLTTFSLTGVTYENGSHFVRRYLESLTEDR
jgi:hypothetical protein